MVSYREPALGHEVPAQSASLPNVLCQGQLQMTGVLFIRQHKRSSAVRSIHPSTSSMFMRQTEPENGPGHHSGKEEREGGREEKGRRGGEEERRGGGEEERRGEEGRTLDRDSEALVHTVSAVSQPYIPEQISCPL